MDGCPGKTTSSRELWTKHDQINRVRILRRFFATYEPADIPKLSQTDWRRLPLYVKEFLEDAFIRNATWG